MLSRKIVLSLFYVILFLLQGDLFASDGGSSGGGGLIEAIGLDPKTILIQILGFLVVLFVLNKFVFGRVGGLLEKRQNEIFSRTKKLKEDQVELTQLKAETQKRLDQIEAEANAKIQSAIEKGNLQRQKIIDDARKEATNLMAQARTEIEEEKEKAISDLQSQIAEIAISAASLIIDRTIDLDSHRHIVDQYVSVIPTRSEEATP